MRRILIVLIGGIILSSGVFFAYSLIRDGTLSGIGWITIRTEPLDLLVKIDGDYVGQTPLDDFQIEAGEHFVEVGDAWQQKLLVAPDEKSVMVLSLAQSKVLSAGYSVGYKKNTTLFSNRAQLVLISDPADTEVYVDGISMGVSPLVLTDQEIGTKQIKFKREGYESIELEASLPEGHTMRVEANLLVNPLADREKISITGLDISQYEAAPPNVISRQVWGGPPYNAVNGDVSLSSWGQIELWGVHAEPEIFGDFLLGLDELIRIREKIPAIPYAYIIDGTGKIYEGLGVYDFDFSVFNNVDYAFTAGIAPVLIITHQSNYLSESVSQALVNLLNYFEQGPEVTAQLISEIATINLSGGDVRGIDLAWQNTSPLIWRRDSFYQVELRKVDANPSELYDPDTWISPTELTVFAEEVVYPGEIATFRVNLRAPYYSGSFVEQLALYDKTREKVVAGSDFMLVVDVQGETDKVLLIQDTPTGFLNVRSGAGINFSLISAIFPGEKMAWTVKEGDWYQIILRDGTKGWILGTYATEL